MTFRAPQRIAFIGSPDKPASADALARARACVEPLAEVVYAEITSQCRRVLEHEPDLLVVLGGDGTLIGAVSELAEHQLPVLGINLGKLGFLAEFTIEQFERNVKELFAGALPITRRVMLEVFVENGDVAFKRPAVNDCVVVAGPPFRIIRLCVRADDNEVTRFRGDGLIVATPTGSTAHNLSAGGPIVEPIAASTILTPICPHALTFRPLVIDASRTIEIRVEESNEGTNVVIDGRTVRPLHADDTVQIRRYPADFLLVHNPLASEWEALRRKLLWGTSPTDS